jgi:putative transposase
VEKYLRKGPVRPPDPKQRWLTLVHNHAKVIVACDFFVVVTATFRTLYVFVIMERDEFSITTSPLTPLRSGPCSSSGKRCRATIRIGL